MSDSRIVTIRKSTCDPSILCLPFLYVSSNPKYSVDSIIRYIDATHDVSMKPDIFPHDIKEYYWIHEGTPGNQAWYALGSLEEGLYFFYTAYTYKMFDTDGHMDLWVSHRFSDLIHFAMDSFTYTKYIQSKISDESTSEPEVNQ